MEEIVLAVIKDTKNSGD